DDRQFELDEAMFRLGQLKAGVWVAKGEESRALYGLTEDGYKMIIELQNGDKTNAVSLEFGGVAPSNYHYALATVEGQSWIFEFPLHPYMLIMRNFKNPPLRAGPTAQAP